MALQKRWPIIVVVLATLVIIGSILHKPGIVAAAPAPMNVIRPDGSLNLYSGYRGGINLDAYELNLGATGEPLITPRYERIGEPSIDTPLTSGTPPDNCRESGSPTTGHPTGGSPDDYRWDSSFASPVGTDHMIQVMVMDGNGRIYVGGRFTSIEGVPASSIAMYDGTAWHSLGEGFFNGTGREVCALAVAPDGTLYAGGEFRRAGDQFANYVASWNGETWMPLQEGNANGVNEEVWALEVANDGTLYVGGFFTMAGTQPANGIAAWDGSAWHSLGSGNANGVTGGNVISMALDPAGNVYIGGNFTAVGGQATDGIGMWNGTAWDTLDGGIGSIIFEMIWHNETLVVVGIEIGGLNGSIARWDGTEWSGIGTGAPLFASDVTQTLDGTLYMSNSHQVFRLVGNTWVEVDRSDHWMAGVEGLQDGHLYRIGDFEWGAPHFAIDIVRLDQATHTWKAFGSEVGNGLLQIPTVLAVAEDGRLFAGGVTSIKGERMGGIAVWDGVRWSPIAPGSTGVITGTVETLTFDDAGNLYVGGAFSAAGGIPANNIARWDGTAWSTIGTGVENGTNGMVKAILIDDNGDLYVGGEFTVAGDTYVDRIARWDGSEWHPLFGGIGDVANEYINVMAFDDNGDLIVGGFFNNAGVLPVQNIARWDGVVWDNIDNGFGTVLGMAKNSQGYLFVIGQGNPLALWTGNAWSNFQDPFPLYKSAITIAPNDDIYIGGSNLFLIRNYVWSVVGGGVDKDVHEMALGQNGDLWVAGPFLRAGDRSAHHITKVATRPLVQSFTTQGDADIVSLQWSTADETDIGGFNLYRADNPALPPALVNVTPIPATFPGQPQGDTYFFADSAVDPLNLYYYWIEVLDLQGNPTRYGYVPGSTQGPTAVTVTGWNAVAGPSTPIWLMVALTAVLLVWRYRRLRR